MTFVRVCGRGKSGIAHVCVFTAAAGGGGEVKDEMLQKIYIFIATH